MKNSTKFIGGIFIILFIGFIWMGFNNSKGDVTGNIISENKDLKVSDQNNKIEIKGSDTIVQLVSNLAEDFSKNNPDTKISVTGGGSGTGIAALLNGEIDLADSSRSIEQKELDLAREKSLDVKEVIIARDMLSVIVNKDNKVDRLTIEELSKIYKGEIKNWNEVGGKDQKITLYGRQSTSGTYTFFLEHVVKGEYSENMRNLEGNQAIFEAVKQDKGGMGYIGIGYLKEGLKNENNKIKAVDVSYDGKDYFSPLDESKINDYPISRGLFQYTKMKPVKGTELYDFIQFELSEQGQKIVEDSGFVKIANSDKQKNNDVLG
ncbi:phosphate-binding protein [Candidatus Pacearchaeota archaeon CG10_big_fil_rev_8_21_14_0_10_32_14]|nr:MAG: phosphate-binding protein [Candidatus Pacearchaeota archaeon CG10_big_fil_rev_8_21_14_0_10_32_14]